MADVDPLAPAGVPVPVPYDAPQVEGGDAPVAPEGLEGLDGYAGADDDELSDVTSGRQKGRKNTAPLSVNPQDLTKPGPAQGYQPLDDIWNRNLKPPTAGQQPSRELVFMALDGGAAWEVLNHTLTTQGVYLTQQYTFKNTTYQAAQNNQTVSAADASITKSNITLKPTNDASPFWFEVIVEYPDRNTDSPIDQKVTVLQRDKITGKILFTLEWTEWKVETQTDSQYQDQPRYQLIATGKSTQYKGESARVIYFSKNFQSHQADAAALADSEAAKDYSLPNYVDVEDIYDPECVQILGFVDANVFSDSGLALLQTQSNLLVGDAVLQKTDFSLQKNTKGNPATGLIIYGTPGKDKFYYIVGVNYTYGNNLDNPTGYTLRCTKMDGTTRASVRYVEIVGSNLTTEKSKIVIRDSEFKNAAQETLNELSFIPLASFHARFVPAGLPAQEIARPGYREIMDVAGQYFFANGPFINQETQVIGNETYRVIKVARVDHSSGQIQTADLEVQNTSNGNENFTIHEENTFGTGDKANKITQRQVTCTKVNKEGGKLQTITLTANLVANTLYLEIKNEKNQIILNEQIQPSVSITNFNRFRILSPATNTGIAHWFIAEVPLGTSKHPARNTNTYFTGFNYEGENGLPATTTIFASVTPPPSVRPWTEGRTMQGPFLSDYAKTYGIKPINATAAVARPPKPKNEHPFSAGAGVALGSQAVDVESSTVDPATGLDFSFVGSARYDVGSGLFRWRPELLGTAGTVEHSSGEHSYREWHGDLTLLAPPTLGNETWRFGLSPTVTMGGSVIGAGGDVLIGSEEVNLGNLALLRGPQWGGAVTASYSNPQLQGSVDVYGLYNQGVARMDGETQYGESDALMMRNSLGVIAKYNHSF